MDNTSGLLLETGTRELGAGGTHRGGGTVHPTFDLGTGAVGPKCLFRGAHLMRPGDLSFDDVRSKI